VRVERYAQWKRDLLREYRRQRMWDRMNFYGPIALAVVAIGLLLYAI
jgi:hypothetical protein